MTWMQDLYATYEKNRDAIGKIETSFKGEQMLLPVGYASPQAQIEVTISPDGEFLDAKVIEEKSERLTPIPVTESSSNRTITPAPHPMHDYLKYVAGDYEKYTTAYKKENLHKLYLDFLGSWSESEFSDPRVKAIYEYLKKGTLIKDLIEKGVLHEKEGKLFSKWDKSMVEERGEKPAIFKAVSSADGEIGAFVRFTTHDSNSKEQEVKVWQDLAVAESFNRFYQTRLGSQGIDYISGRSEPFTSAFGSGIRYGGDQAKLISANDPKNFTYRGRFITKEQVAQIGYLTIQKSQNALKWLIQKQGYLQDGRVFLIWDEAAKKIPQLQDDYADLFAPEEEEQNEKIDLTQAEYAHKVRAALNGYRTSLDNSSKINIMIIDAATPGRMGVLYYNSLNKEDYFKRIETWHRKGWWHHSRYVNKHWYRYWGVPNIREIAQLAYGARANEKMLNQVVENLFTCIADGRRIPTQIYQQLLRRTSNPASMEEWEWAKALTCACSITKLYFDKEELTVSLNQDYIDRSYLYGRLLAVADAMEKRALKNSGAARTTSAKRYMNAFSMQPFKTWKIIRENLIPYEMKLGDQAIFYQQLFQEISSKFVIDEFNDKPLDGCYLLGYDSQLQEIYNHNKPQEEQ